VQDNIEKEFERDFPRELERGKRAARRVHFQERLSTNPKGIFLCEG
jgi:hypothetical protein